MSVAMMSMMFKELQGMRADREGVPSGGSASVARVLRAYSKMRSDIKVKPREIVRRYMEGVADSMGVTDGQVWSLRDHSKFLTWGRHRTLFRMHVLLGAILQLLLKGEALQAQALTVQGLKSVHQSALDQGSWQNAWLLTGLADPTQRQRFAGEEHEMEIIAQYSKTLDELEKKVTPSGGGPRTRAAEEDAVGDADDSAGDPKGAGKGPRKKKA